MLQVVDASDPGDTLLFAGDWFDDQASIPTDALDATREIVSAIVDKGLHAFFLVGNHDQLSRDGMVHSIGLLHRPSDKMFVIDEPTITDGWAFLPFRRPADLPGALAALDALYHKKYPSGAKQLPILCHVDLIGGVANAGHLSSRGLKLSDFPEWAPIIVSGHYHKHQVIEDRFVFVGSPYQITAGEAGDTKVWLEFKTPPWEITEMKTVEFTGLPRFIEMPAPDWQELPESERDELISSDFVTVVVPHDKRISNLPEGVAQKPLPKPLSGGRQLSQNSSTPEALSEWLIRRGRSDLLENGLGFLNATT